MAATASNAGVLKPFSEGEDIDCFLERLEQYFTANAIDAERQVATLLTMIDEKTYKVLKSIVHPMLPKQKKYIELETALKMRYKPRTSYYRKRTAFDKMRQDEGECVTKWYARVRQTAADCNFENIEERVKDKFVTGMKQGPVYERLCEEDVKKELKELIEIALNKESVLQERAQINKVTQRNQGGHRQATKKTNKEQSQAETEGLKCIHCGKVVMTYINITSVKLFVKVQNIFGVCKVFACLIVIGGGIYEIAKGNTEHLNKGFEGSRFSPGGIALALYSGLWAYDGWNSVTVVTEEIINPGVNVPLSISIAVPLITALYVFMNVAYMTVLSYSEMTSVPAVAVAFGTRVLGPASFLIPLGVAIATFGCAMSVQFGVTRVCYTAARGGHMLEVFSYVNLKRMTPAPAVAFQALLTTVFILVGNIKTLIEFASWFLWFFYGLAMVALLVLRKTQAKKLRPYRVPTLVPCFVLVVAIFLSILPIVHDPSLKYLMAVGFILMGVSVYTVFVYYKKTPTAILRKFTFLTQVLFESVPPSNRQD